MGINQFIMLNAIIHFSVKNKLIIGLFIFGLIGYGSYQLKKIFNVKSYEISVPRAKYARDKLGVNIINESELDSLKNNNRRFDFFFMSHVLEHVPNPSETLDLGLKLVRKGGYIVSFTPNGSMEHKKKNSNWSKLWGMVHPNFIDEKFYEKFFNNNIYYIGSSKYNLKNIFSFIVFIKYLIFEVYSINTFTRYA